MSTHTKMELFNLFTSRSQDCPLDIKMEIHDGVGQLLRLDGADPAQDEDAARLEFVQVWTTALVAHISRWRAFHLDVPFEDDLRRVVVQLAGLCAPQLESFGITVLHDVVESIADIPVPWRILSVPSLRSLSISQYRITNISQIGFRLVRLTANCHDCYLEYLNACPNLHSAQLSFVAPLTTQHGPFTHGTLQELDIIFQARKTPWSNIIHIFNSLLLPSLTKLKLDLSFSQRGLPVSFVHLIQSPTLFPQLKSLSIEIYPQYKTAHDYNAKRYTRHFSHLLALLKGMPTIDYLQLTFVLQMKELFVSLGDGNLPNLRTLRFEQCGNASGIGNELVEMLEARKQKQAVIPIQNLEIRYCPVLSRVDYDERIRQLVPNLLWLSYRSEWDETSEEEGA